MNECAEKWKRGMVILLGDLRLLGSLLIAEFIVWRVVTHRRKEESHAVRSGPLGLNG